MACCQVTADVLVSLSTSHSTTVYFGADASAPCLCWKDAAWYWFNIKQSRHMAGNSPTVDIRRWWDRLSPQWEFLSQLGILILLGQHFDIDQVPGMTCMKTIKKIKLFWKHMINHVLSRDFYSRMVLYTCRILIGSIVGVTFWWASVKSHWSCWTVLWHKPVLIIQSRSYFCRQNILLALNFEKRIWEHIDVNIDHIFHFQTIDLQVYFLPQNILVKLISCMKNLIPWHVSLMLYQITGTNIPMSFATYLLRLMK